MVRASRCEAGGSARPAGGEHSGGEASAQFSAASSKVAATREAIASIGDSASELVLTQMCADVCKVTHLLRAHGLELCQAELQEFDQSLMVGVATALAG